MGDNFLGRLLVKKLGVLLDNVIFSRKTTPVLIAIGGSIDLDNVVAATDTAIDTAINGFTALNHTVLAGKQFIPMKLIAVKRLWATDAGVYLAVKNTTPGTDIEIIHSAIQTGQDVAVLEYPMNDPVAAQELGVGAKIELFAAPETQVNETRIVEMYLWGITVDA